MLFALVKKELLALTRDVHGLAALFLMPTVFIVIMSLALKDVYSPPVKSLPYVVDNRDNGKLAVTLIEEWEKRHGKARQSPDNWKAAVQSGKLSYALIIEKDFSKAIVDEKLADGIRARLITDPGLDGSAFAANQAELVLIASEMRAQALLAASRMQLAQQAQMIQQVQQALQAAGQPRQLPPPKASNAPVTVTAQALVDSERLAAGSRPTAVQQNVPAWLVFGMFFVVASLSNLFIQERQCGALARLSSLGVPTRVMIWSKALPYLWINGIQAALMLAVGVWVMPLLGGDALSLQGINWGALALVLLGVSMAAISMALALASLVRTSAQAATIGPVVNILMAALGGVMVPKFVMPDFMQRISEFSPMNWGLEGMLDVMLRGSDMAGVVQPVSMLMG
ncbi:MAG: ABC transporter permease, partial [Nitrosomonadales bacterium]|nr:ABC transporter permease [Nitrosomonadales bacterium]